jgi:pilus assembly protein Flp/PilA
MSENENEEGASAVEYSILVALIATVIIATVITLGLDVLGLFQTLNGAF